MWNTEENDYLDAGIHHELSTSNEIDGANYLRSRSQQLLEILRSEQKLHISNLDAILTALYFIRYLDQASKQRLFVSYEQFDTLFIVSFMIEYKVMNEHNTGIRITRLCCQMFSASFTVLRFSERSILKALDWKVNIRAAELIHLVEIIQTFPSMPAARYLLDSNSPTQIA